MKRNLLMTMLLGLVTIVASANDGVFFVNGSHVVPLEETDVAVTKEVLTITLGDDQYARVDVQYEFTNRGKAKTVDVGFEAQSPYNAEDGGLKTGKHPYIYDFVVEMNGQKLPLILQKLFSINRLLITGLQVVHIGLVTVIILPKS